MPLRRRSTSGSDRPWRQLKIDYLLTYGTLGSIIARAAGLPTAVQYDQKNILAEYLFELLTPGDVVLVKGSRGMRMEDVVLFITGTGRCRTARAPHERGEQA